MASPRSSKLYAGGATAAGSFIPVYTSAAGRVTLVKFVTTWQITGATHECAWGHLDPSSALLAVWTDDNLPSGGGNVVAHSIGAVLEPGEQIGFFHNGPVPTWFLGAYGSILST